jgi:RNA polymerase sigma factor (sigma-70 family)
VTDSPMTPQTDVDRDLIDGIRAADEDAMAAFDQRFRGRLLGAAQRRGMDLASAEDIVQETLLAAIVQITEDKFQERSPLGAWVWSIFDRRRADRARQDKRRNATFVPLGLGEAPPSLTRLSTPDEALAVHELKWRVREIFGALTPRERMVLLLSAQRGLTAWEIARLLKLGKKTTEAALTAARKRFARLWHEGEEKG